MLLALLHCAAVGQFPAAISWNDRDIRIAFRNKQLKSILRLDRLMARSVVADQQIGYIVVLFNAGDVCEGECSGRCEP